MVLVTLMTLEHNIIGISRSSKIATDIPEFETWSGIISSRDGEENTKRFRGDRILAQSRRS